VCLLRAGNYLRSEQKVFSKLLLWPRCNTQQRLERTTRVSGDWLVTPRTQQMSRARHSDATSASVLRHKTTEKSNLEVWRGACLIRRCRFYMSCSSMTTESASKERQLHEGAVTDHFLNDPSEESLSALVRVFVSQLVVFFRARGRKNALAEDLAQQVMLTVYRKAGQIRDRSLISCMAIQDRPQRALPARGSAPCNGGSSTQRRSLRTI
jgi:hypothetical protein